ncbi:hypothetical protein [Salinigranum marinum]|uniref:hypothetical protein n=1 Tax=Salinigranum marinum TaxID=1515595 RepID=UPI002989E11C|nr:hypothetical protein [Salinigranum marinum]
MADVTPPPRPRRRSRCRSDRGRDDRGQLFLVAALTLAVLFVGLALLLNTAIYTENLATRNTDPGTDPSIGYRATAEESARELLRRENANNTGDPAKDYGYPTVSDWYVGSVGDWSNGTGLHAARHARVASVSVDATEHGTRIEQSNASRAFTNRSGAADWTLATGIDVRDVRFTVAHGSVVASNDSALANDPFRVELDNSTDTWKLYVYDDIDTGGDDVSVAVVNDTGFVGECTRPGSSPAAIDVSNGSVNGTACPALETVALGGDANVEDSDVSFVNADHAGGTYELTVSSGSGFTNFYDNDGTGPSQGSPFITAVVYDATVTITYESTDVYYRATIRLAPEEL